MVAPRLQAFRGRDRERQVVDRLLETVRGGNSAVLVVRGGPGVGKTALLRYCARQASGFRVVQIGGVESEMELPYAGLHQLCASMLDHLDRLPAPQQDAIRVAFGLASGEAPDRFLVALAALGLLAEVAVEVPLLCLVDDAQWLDGASALVLGFVARRLVGESVAMLFGVREPSTEHELRGLTELPVEGLDQDDARALLATVVAGRLDARVRDRIIAETGGNPLALLELPRGMTAAELAGGFALPGAGDLTGHLEDHYLRRLGTLPAATQRLMLLAAADPTGDATLLWRAAQTLGIAREAAAAAETEQMLEIGARVRFRHPLVRSTVYRSSTGTDRRAAHAALATVTDAETDPDRRAWHRAQATSGPDEDVAAELERSAGRAEARGGLAAAAAFLERSANLTSEPSRRVERMLAAAQCNIQAGGFETALGLLAAAESPAVDELTYARIELLRARVVSASDAGGDAPAQLLLAAKRLEPLDATLARETYLDAWGAALFAGDLATGNGLLEVSRAAQAGPQAADPRGPTDLLLDGLALLLSDGRAAAAPTLGRAVSAFGAGEVSAEHWLQWGVLASSAAVTRWDFENWDVLSNHHIELARGAGALALLSVALNGQEMIAAWRGDFDAAASVGSEAEAVQEATRTRIAPYGPLLLAALQGRTAVASTLIDATIEDSAARGEGLGVQLADWTTAVLNNGLGRYDVALDAAARASDENPGLFISAWALPELIEAATRTGEIPLAADALVRLAEITDVFDSDWALGIEARSHAALLHDGDEAESRYLIAIDRLGRTPLRPELARARLLYGEWLRRQRRRLDAREQLRSAFEMFDVIGMEAFADRARHELLATGETVRKRREDTRAELTPQEEHIASLARDGRTNSQIGAELYLSARTVEWHLRKVFTKLGISSRKELHDALPGRGRNAVPG